MVDFGRVTCVLLQAPDGDTDELLELTGQLRAELLELDVDSVELVEEQSGPEHAKGLAVAAGWLAVQLGNVERLRALLGAVFAWTARTHREVEVSYGGDILKVSGVTAEQQEKIVDAWLARLTPGS